MRICILTSSYPRWVGDAGGWFVGRLAKALAQAGAQVTVIAPDVPTAPRSEFTDGVRVHRIPYFWPRNLQRLAYGEGIPWNLRHSIWAWLNVPTFLVALFLATVRFSRHADVVNAHWGVQGAIAVLARLVRGFPVILNVRGSDLKTPSRLIQGVTILAIRRCDAVVATSDEFVQWINNYRASADCHKVPNGVDMPAPELVRRRLGTPPAGRLISVGRLAAERRLDQLIRAFAKVRQRFPSADLTLIGKGPRRGELEQLAQDLGIRDAVEFAGVVPHHEVSSWLLNSDLYVSATSAETFGNAIAEAAACGLPIVTTRVGFPAELVIDGQGGYVVQVGDERALEQAILKVLTLPDGGREMGQRMRARLEQFRLGWSDCAAKMLQIYAESITKRSPRRKRANQPDSSNQ